MRRLFEFLLLVTLVVACGCGTRSKTAPGDVTDKDSAFLRASEPTVAAAPGANAKAFAFAADSQGGDDIMSRRTAQQQGMSALAGASEPEGVTPANDRKIIKSAELSIEVDAPKEAQARVASIAEEQGGFVVTSEFKQSGTGATKPTEIVTIVVRVPASQFGVAVEAIRGTGNRVLQEKRSGQDVTEEYIDLEARIRTQKALEAQFLEIMKQAKKVEEALQVQRQLAEVRTEIERLEGRRRFLDNKSSLSTITVSLQTATPMVTATTSGFGHDVREAFGDGIDTAVGIVLGVIRTAIIFVPIAILILLPAFLILRRVLRRFPWPKRQQPLVVTPAE